MTSRSKRAKKRARGPRRRAGTSQPASPPPPNDPDPHDFGLARTDAFTVEGQIEREALLVSGAKRLGGWRKWVVYSVLLGPIVLLVVALLASVVRML